MEDNDVNLIWDINIQYDCYGGKEIQLNFSGQKMKLCPMVDVAIPGDCRIREKEIEEV